MNITAAAAPEGTLLLSFVLMMYAMCPERRQEIVEADLFDRVAPLRDDTPSSLKRRYTYCILVGGVF